MSNHVASRVARQNHGQVRRRYSLELSAILLLLAATNNAAEISGVMSRQIYPPGVDGWFIVNGVDEFGEKYPLPIASSYPDMPVERQRNNVVQPSIPIRNIAVDSARKQIRIDLAESGGEGATVSYAYTSHILGTLTNGQGYPAPGFTYIPIPSENLDTQARTGRP